MDEREMILKMYAVYDTKAEAYATPFCMNTVMMAIRAFADQANDPETMIGKYPTDYDLFEVGSWDDNTGRIEAHITPLHICKALEHVQTRQSWQDDQAQLFPSKDSQGSNGRTSPEASSTDPTD